MLQQMREWFRYLKWLLLVVVFMFIVWAGATYTGSGARSGADNEGNWAARVNGTTIEAQAFLRYARQLDSTYQSLFGDQYSEQRGLIRVGRQAINSMVDEELLYQAATRQGLGVSSEEVAQEITRDPSFQRDGRFIGLEEYRRLFRSAGVSVTEYEGQVRRRVLVGKYRDLVGDGAAVTNAEVEDELLRRNQRASVEWILVEPDRLAAKAPDDAALQAYYDAHRDRYMRGEGRTGQFVAVNAGGFAGTATVTDDDVRAAYERDLATRYTVREQRRASHILLKVPAGAAEAEASAIESRARDLLRRAKAGEDFAALARRHSEDTSASNGGDLNFFGRGQMVREFEEAAFSIPVGSISDLVRTTYGFHIIKVTDAREGRVQPLEEVRDRIRDDLTVSRARTLAQDRAAQLAAAAAGGRLEAAATSLGLQVAETGPVHPGDALPGVAASQSAVTRMIAMQPGEVSEAIPVPGGQVVIQVTGIVPDAPRPLPDVRARVEKDFLDERRREELREQAASAGSLAALAKRYRAEVRSQDDLARGAGLPGLPRDPAIESQINTLEPGTIGEPVVVSSGLVVLTVRSRDAHREEFGSQMDSTRDSLVTQQRERLIRAHIRGLRDQGKVAINEALVESVDRS